MYVEWLTEAITHGARKKSACGELGISLRTFQRWMVEGEVISDGRTTAFRQTPANALSETERQAILALCNSQEFAHLPPSQIVPRLADQGRYIGSESSFYRGLRAADQLAGAGAVLLSVSDRRYLQPQSGWLGSTHGRVWRRGSDLATTQCS